jgi:guanine deaminase
VYIAHCPQSNINLSSGIAPISRFLKKGINIGLGSDIAGGSSLSILRAMSDAIQVSKLYWRLIDQNDKPLTVQEAFYLGTIGGGSFFGKVGSFDEGYEFDAVVINDDIISSLTLLTLEERLTRIIYLSDDRNIHAKFCRGIEVTL